MARILVTEEIADSGLQALRDAGHEVDVQLGLSPEALLEAVPGAAALIIRSATKVTAPVIEVADALQVVGRAGIGLDNVDVAAATKRGVMVVNAPQSNILSAAEHTMALLLGMARNEETLEATTYAERLPEDLSGRQCYVLDLMLATGGTLAAAIRFLVGRGADDVTAICLLSAPEGCERVTRDLGALTVPVTVVTAAMDQHLNEKGYIVPGLGDAGDRLYGLAH